ncbi:unnamed protein product [Ectocarpus sp. 4 AP-2014]
MAASVAIGDEDVIESGPHAKSQSQPQIMPADKLVDSIFRAISCTDANNSNANGSSSNGDNANEAGGINVPGAVDGGGDTRAALKELILAVQGKLEDKLAPPPARRAQGASLAVAVPNAAATAASGRGHRQEKCVYLKVTVVEGRALVGELANERTTSSALYNFSIDLQFNAQRARTRNEVRCCVEPSFGSEGFVFVLREAHELPVTAGGWASFLQTDLPLHVVLTKHKVSRIRPRPRDPHAQPGAGVGDGDGDGGAPGARGYQAAVAAEEDEHSVSALFSEDGSRRGELVGTAEVDWRRALVPASGAQEDLHKSGGVLLAVELASAAPDSIVHPVGGILHLRLEVVAPPDVSAFPFKADDVMRIMDFQASKRFFAASVRSEARRDFYHYANAWWKGFSSTSKVLSKRSVKIFAEDERGQHRCVCSFLEPYRQGRMLPTPRHAARFVSLLPFRPRSTVGEQPPATQRAWNSPHAFLAAGTGDASDHALLLCSLLLGFGLDALVCCGLVHPSDDDNGEGDASGAEPGGVGLLGGDSDGNRGEETGHMWVCTFSGNRADKKAVFWESLTGQRFAMSAPQPRPSRGKKWRRTTPGKMAVTPRHFSKVSCMFNHREFFANKQSNNRVGTTSLDISDPKLWKPMDSSRIVPKGISYPMLAGPAGVVLFRPTLNTEGIAEGVESEVKRRVAAWREGKGWPTVWDDALGYLLGPAVFAYEQERVSGASFGGDDFQDAVQGAVPDRHCFKGYPTCFDHLSCSKMLASLLDRTVARDILSSKGDHLRFALRSSVFAYPDGALAVWLMLACRFEGPTN